MWGIQYYKFVLKMKKFLNFICNIDEKLLNQCFKELRSFNGFQDFFFRDRDWEIFWRIILVEE